MKNYIKLSLLLVAIVMSGCSQATADSLPIGSRNKKRTADSTFPNQRLESNAESALPASQVEPVDFSGSPSEMGRQHGILLKSEIIKVVENWLSPIRNLIPLVIDMFISSKSAKLVGNLPADFRAELSALADAVDLPEGEKPILIGNLTPDLMAMAQRPLGCSTFVVMPERSKTGGMIFGRNLDYAFSDYLRGQWRPIIFRKSGKHAILSLSVAGVIGVISGINERGVAMTINMSHTTDPYSTDGVGALAIFRAVLEVASTAEEARELYASYRRTIAVNVTIADGKSAYVLEATPSRSKYRPPGKGVLYAANHYVFSELGDSTKPDFRWSILQSKDTGNEVLGLAEVRSIIASAGIEKTNVLAFILDYAGKKLYFGSQKTKAIAGPLSVVDLANFLKN